MTLDFLIFLILLMATWRVSSLLVNEDGPLKVFVTVRTIFERLEVLTCLWCTSVWVGLAWTGAYWLWPEVTGWMALPFALSAGAVAWDKWNGG